MMDYKILYNGELINTIVASEEFVSAYCAENGYTYEPVAKPEPEPEPGPEYVTYEELAAAIREGVIRV